MKKNAPAEPIKTVLGTLQDNKNICKGMPPETEIKLAMPESVHQKLPEPQSAIGLFCRGGMATRSILTGRKRFLKNKKGEHVSFFVKDPNGYVLEFKSFKNNEETFTF